MDVPSEHTVPVLPAAEGIDVVLLTHAFARNTVAGKNVKSISHLKVV